MSAKRNAPTAGTERGAEEAGQQRHARHGCAIVRQDQEQSQSSRMARAYLHRLRCGQATADELAALVAMQPHATALLGFCRVIERGLGART
jgi:hypothetical protein